MEGTYVYLWLTRVDVWQKPTQCCKAITFQLKVNFKKEMKAKTTYKNRKYIYAWGEV